MKRSTRLRQLDRRELLARMGSAALALPFLQATAGRARAQTAAKAKNFLMITMPNGIDPLEFWPKGGERDFTLSPVLQPLQAHRDKLLLIGPQANAGGAPVANTGLVLKKTPGIHRAWVATTGHSVSWPRTPQTGDGLTVRTMHPSVDQLIAKQLAAKTRFPSLEFGIRPVGGDVPCIVNFAMDGSPLPRMADDKTAFNRVFGGLTSSPTTPGMPDRNGPRRAAVTDFLHSRFEALTPSLGAEDRRLLDGHLQSLRELEGRIGTSTPPPAACAVSEVMRTFMPATPTMPTNPTSDAPALYANMQDMVALAFACDLTRVASISISFEGGGSTGGLIPTWLGFNANHHGSSHHGGNATKRERFNKVINWGATMLARQLDQLKRYAHPDGGTVYDQTVVWWMFRHGDGNAHANHGVPGIIAGGAGGYFGPMGRFLRLPDTSFTSLPFTLVNSMGLSIPAFGMNENRVTTGLAALRA
jgi:Protein of unknown function (DUF1552)